MTYGDSQLSDYPYAVTRIPRQAYPLRLSKYGLASRELLSWADLTYIHTIDLPLWGSRHAPRIIKIVGDQAWERCIRKGWIPPDMNIDDFQTYEGNWQVRWQKQSRSKQVKAMDGVIVPSQYLKSVVMGWGIEESKIHVVYNALPEQSNNGNQAEELPIKIDKHPTLLTVARLHPWKGIDHLITALQSIPDVQLIVAGDGPDMPRLQSLAKPLAERITFLGQIPHEQVLQLMRAVDGVALYSGYEGLSHTLLESLQVGTPILASDKGGNPEVVQHDVNGLLVPYVDISALKQSIEKFLLHHERYKKNTHIGLDRFTLEAMVTQTDKTLTSFL